MMVAIRKSLKDFLAILVLVILALLVAAFILHKERLRFPWEASPYKLKAEFATAQAVTPGQGQTVRVSGVKIGDISKVDLKDGRAVVTLDIDHQYKNVIHTDATALLRPKTGLKDMFVEVTPNPTGKRAPVASENWTMPVSRTLPDINPDEIFAALDGDSRAYLQLLVNGAGQGLKGRGGDLGQVFQRFEPTHYLLAKLTSSVATRRVALRRLITSLHTLNTALAGKKTDLSQLVDSSSAVFRSFAAEQASIRRAVADLPGTLQQTTTTLGKVQSFANVLGPAARNLIPVANALPAANNAVAKFAKPTTPIVRDQIRPFVRDARPLVRNLRPTALNLARATPDLTRSFVVLNHLFNTLGYNPGGPDGKNDATISKGYLFWLAWLDHQGLQLFSADDANAGWRPLFLTLSCGTIQQLVDSNVDPNLAAIQGLAPVLPLSKISLTALKAAGACA
jgi:phospholipid/cholesterol/gamma-HCH transport system substrate-binding protein